MPGPLPKRVEERRRRNAVPGETIVMMDEAVLPPALPVRPRPHPVAAAWYESLKESGQSAFFEPSDWAAAVYAVQVITKSLRVGASAAMMSAAWGMMDALLTTELARRKARLQVQRALGGEKDEIQRPTALDGYRKALGG